MYGLAPHLSDARVRDAITHVAGEDAHPSLKRIAQELLLDVE